jgi:hypothetical protein
MSIKLDTINNIKNVFSPVRHELSHKYLNLLVPVLNQFHNTTYSERFWEILLKSYVGFVISNLEYYEREICGFYVINQLHNGF